MPHDSHTTHEPDRVGREGDETIPGLGHDDEISRQPALLMFGRFDPLHRADDLAPATN